MEEFSREYLQAKGLKSQGDFSIKEIFRKVKEGCYVSEICEGFGSIGIARIENKCKLMFPGENDEVEYVDFKKIFNEIKKSA